MNKGKTSLSNKNKMVTTKTKQKVVPCSTPERNIPDSPSRDSDSLCGSDAASPVPFFCTQDGEGDTDVVWNYYTPKAEQNAKNRPKNSTPLSRKSRRLNTPIIIEKPKRKIVRAIQKNTQVIEGLTELNENIDQLFVQKNGDLEESPIERRSDDDIFSNCSDSSPKSCLRSDSRCLRKNLLSSKFSKPDTDNVLESDDSMNEQLLTASQMVEDKLKYGPTPAKQPCYNLRDTQSARKKLNNDSMDSLMYNIKLESPIITKTKQAESPAIHNDSFDSFMDNLNDSALDRLIQVPVKKDTSNPTNCIDNSEWTVKEVQEHESPSSKVFGRYSSMPESPTIRQIVKPSTSGMAFSRYNSLPYNNQNNLSDTSPIRCTPDEIRRKHQQAREKLLAKRLPFTATQESQDTKKLLQSQQGVPSKRAQFQPKTASSNTNSIPVTRVNSMPAKNNETSIPNLNNNNKVIENGNANIKLLIEKKRQEALSRLRKRLPQIKDS